MQKGEKKFKKTSEEGLLECNGKRRTRGGSLLGPKYRPVFIQHLATVVSISEKNPPLAESQ